MNDFINGVEVSELTQEQMNELVRRRVSGGHKISQNGDSFDVYKLMTAIDVVDKELKAQQQASVADSESATPEM